MNVSLDGRWSHFFTLSLQYNLNIKTNSDLFKEVLFYIYIICLIICWYVKVGNLHAKQPRATKCSFNFVRVGSWKPERNTIFTFVVVKKEYKTVILGSRFLQTNISTNQNFSNLNYWYFIQNSYLGKGVLTDKHKQ